jgi:opacity protein-like surface antigen
VKRLILSVTALLIAFAAHDAAAQGFISPFIGTTLTSPSPKGNSSKPGYGVAFGNLGTIVGFDSEIAYFPEVLDNAANAIAKSRAFTFSGDTLIWPTIGPIKVYGAVGVGDMYVNVTSLSSIVIPNPANISTNYFTLNVGGGVMAFFTTHLGVRGDLRYFRAYGFDISDLQGAGITLNHFDFWRASVGLAAKF